MPDGLTAGAVAPSAPTAPGDQAGLKARTRLQLVAVVKVLAALLLQLEPGGPEYRAAVSALKALTPAVGSVSEGLTDTEHMALQPTAGTAGPAPAGPAPQAAPAPGPEAGPSGGVAMGGPRPSLMMGGGA